MNKYPIRQMTSDIALLCILIIAIMIITDSVTLIILAIMWTIY